MPRFPALWKAYQNVVFQLEGRAPFWPSFAIITASNPASLTCASLVNRCANAALPDGCGAEAMRAFCLFVI